MDGEEPPVPGPELRRYPDGERKPPRRDKAMIYSYMVTTSPDDPLFVGEALSRSDASEWRAAMNDDNRHLLEEVKGCLSETFDIKDLGEVSCYLGVSVTRDHDKGALFLNQEARGVSTERHQEVQDGELSSCVHAPVHFAAASQGGVGKKQ